MRRTLLVNLTTVYGALNMRVYVLLSSRRIEALSNKSSMSKPVSETLVLLTTHSELIRPIAARWPH